MCNMLSNRILLAFVLMALVFVSTGCMGGDGIRAYPPQRGIDARLVGAANLFGFDLLTRIAHEQAAENLLISPMGIFISLTLASMGAENETRESMAKTLRINHIEKDEIERGATALLYSLMEADSLVHFDVAVSLWHHVDISPRETFIQNAENSFQASVKEIDFTETSSINTINNWLDGRTRGLIAEVPLKIEQDILMLLLSAVSFSGTWTDTFQPERTFPGVFLQTTGGESTIPMMSREGNFAYLETELFQAVALPYGRERLSMYVFLPQEDRQLTDIAKELTTSNWNNWLGRFTTTNGSLTLPRFQVKAHIELEPYLAAMGMGGAFQSTEADFSGIATTPPDIFLNHVTHISRLDVDEGVEKIDDGALGEVSTSIETGFEMTVERPFFFAIRDELTGIILMAGFIHKLS